MNTTPRPLHLASALTLALAFSLAALPAAARDVPHVTASRVMTTETRSVGGFHGIALGIDAKVEVRQNATEGLTITGDGNVVPLIETRVDNGTLKIRWAGNRSPWIDGERISIVVSAKELDSLWVGGSGLIHAAAIKTDALHLNVAGSGDIVIDALDAQSAAASVDGSGTLKVAGRTDSFDASISGSGRLITSGLQSRHAKVALAGSGDASVWASETLNARVAGSGSVKYVGTPVVTVAVAGSGTVKPASVTR
jgi:hypothetical protein